MLMSLAAFLHVLAAVVWVGGMFFAYCLLRPVLTTVEEPQRLALWARICTKFFPWVWLCIIVLLVSGLYLIHQMGGFSQVDNSINLMGGLAVIMILVFKFVYVAPFKHLCRGVEEKKWKVAAYALGTIRTLMAVNLTLGILTIATAIVLKGW